MTVVVSTTKNFFKKNEISKKILCFHGYQLRFYGNRCLDYKEFEIYFFKKKMKSPKKLFPSMVTNCVSMVTVVLTSDNLTVYRFETW